jgi:hypothetical protein
MALDYDLNLKVFLETEPKHKILYKWCLKEAKENGEQVGRDLIPFNWNVVFHSTSFGIQRSISSDRSFRFDETEEITPLKFSQNDTIFAKLDTGYYDDDSWRAPSIAMIGSNRSVKEVNLVIGRVDDVERETCAIWGTVAYEVEIDFRNERTEDSIQVYFNLENEKFDSLFDLVRKNEIDRLSLRLSDVEGFYSDWSPGISADSIKVLANITDQGLEVDEEWAKRIPTLGKVGEASLTVQRTLSAKLPERTGDDYADDSADDWLNDNEDADHAREASQPARDRPEEQRHKFYERALSRISKLLGILIVIELVRAFSS